MGEICFVWQVVRFIPGSLDFGYIHDEERPLVSAVSRSRRLKLTSSIDDDAEDQMMLHQSIRSTAEASTQTEDDREETVDAGVQTERTRHHSVSGIVGSSRQKEAFQVARPAKHY